jgi:hypothetical protein
MTKQAAARSEARRSTRSHSSFTLEQQVLDLLAQIDTVIAYREKQIPKLAAEKQSLLERVHRPAGKDGGVVYAPKLEEKTMALNVARELLSDHEKERARLRGEIDAFTPSAEQLAERTRRQDLCAELVGKRAGSDALIDKAVESLRRMLQGRGEATAEIAKCASGIALAVGEDSFDGRRAEELLAALPENFGAESERWCAWFLGERKNVTAYVVADHTLQIAETLAHSGFYHFSETIEVTPEEARELLRSNRPAPTSEKHWASPPPSIMTVEAFEALRARAEKESTAPEAIVKLQNIEREERLRKANFGMDRQTPAPATLSRQYDSISAAQRGEALRDDKEV